MKRQWSKEEILALIRATIEEDGTLTINDGLSVDNNANVVVGNSLHVENKLIISDKSMIVDENGIPLF